MIRKSHSSQKSWRNSQTTQLIKLEPKASKKAGKPRSPFKWKKSWDHYDEYEYGEGISCKIEAVEASEDLVTGGPTHHMQDVIKLARTFAINFLSKSLVMSFLQMINI